MTRFRIVPDDLTSADVLELLQLHLAEMSALSPAEKVHAMPAERLRAPDVTFYSAWGGPDLAAVGALKDLGGGRGELKSMRAAPAWRGRGAGRAMLDHLMTQARSRGMTWLGLETGRPIAFADAQRLYAANGFAECENFDAYSSDEFSMCMSRTL